MNRWIASALLSACLATPVCAGEARLLLSWNAPYGRPGARENVDASCDSARTDTLYLSIDSGRDAEHFLGMSATLYFHAAEDQPLAEFWKFADLHAPGAPIKVLFEAQPERGFNTPWTSKGMGSAQYDYSAGSGRLRMIYAVGAGSSDPVRAGKPFGVARVLVRRPATGTASCSVPMCVEWHASSLAFGPGDEPVVNKGARFVSLNSPAGSVCSAVRGTTATGTWKPKSAKP